MMTNSHVPPWVKAFAELIPNEVQVIKMTDPNNAGLDSSGAQYLGIQVVPSICEYKWCPILANSSATQDFGIQVMPSMCEFKWWPAFVNSSGAR